MKTAKISIFIAAAFLFFIQTSPAKALLSYAEVAAQGRVLGETTAVIYPYPTGALVSDGGTIYFISGATKIPFTSWKAFVGLGYSLKNVVKGDLSNYMLPQSYAINTASAVHPWGQWLSYRNTVYYSAQEGLIPVPSAAVFADNGGQWKLVVKANKYDLAVLKANPNLTPLVSNDGRVAAAPTYGFGSGSASQTPPGQSFGFYAPSPTNIVSTSTLATLTASPGTLNAPTFSTASPVSQFVPAGATDQLIAVFNFTATGAPVAIVEMDFALGSTPNNEAPPIEWVHVVGEHAPILIGASSPVLGLGIIVPNTVAGVNIPVTVNYTNVNAPNSPANQSFSLVLTGVKYLTAGQTIPLSLSLSSNTMNLISSIPRVSISGPSGNLTDGPVLLGQVTVSAIGGGGIVLRQLPISLSVLGKVSASSSPNNLVVTDNGYLVDTTNQAVSFDAGTSTTGSTIIFNSDNFIGPNSSKTYAITITLQGAVDISAGPSSVQTSLGGPTGFIFDDVASGTSGLNIPGSIGAVSILNYPTTAISAHN